MKDYKSQHNGLDYSGPYDKNALIQMIAMLLPIPEDIITKIEKDFFSKE